MPLYWNIFFFFFLVAPSAHTTALGDPHREDVVYEYTSLKFESLQGEYSSAENVIDGIQVYNDTVYVNILRLNGNVPVTLATVEKKNGGKNVLFKPFPSLKDQTLGECNALQSVGGIRVVRKTNRLYVADNKYSQCKAKLVIIDLVKKKVITRYEFPDNVVAKKDSTQFGDIVVDREGKVYIANAGGLGSIIVYDSKKSNSLAFHHRLLEMVKPVTFKFGNDSYTVNRSIDQMTLSPDDAFLFLVKENSNTIQVPTVSFQDTLSVISVKEARSIGMKMAKGFGILMGQRYMYLTGAEEKLVYVWDRNADLEKQKSIVQNAKGVVMETQTKLEMKPELSLYPGKMSFDNYGNLWIVTMDYQLYFGNSTEGDGYETKIVKLRIDDSREKRTTSTAALDRRLLISVIVAMVMLCIVL